MSQKGSDNQSNKINLARELIENAQCHYCNQKSQPNLFDYKYLIDNILSEWNRCGNFYHSLTMTDIKIINTPVSSRL